MIQIVSVLFGSGVHELASLTTNVTSWPTPRFRAAFDAIRACTGLIVIPVTRQSRFFASQIADPPMPQPISSTVAPRGIALAAPVAP